MDHDGNDSTRTADSVTRTLSWTADGRLSSVSVGSVTLSYRYNAFGQLVQRSRKVGAGADSVEREFLWDQGQLLAELNGNGTNRIAEYAYWPGVDAPYALVTGAQSIAARRYYSQDAMGDVTGLVTSSAVSQSLIYEPFGELDSTYTQLGTLGDSSRLRWKGLIWEGDSTRLYYVRSRWYDPYARRFVSEDPIGLAGGINPYRFANNDPINGFDPTGMDCIIWTEEDIQNCVGYEDVIAITAGMGGPIIPLLGFVGDVGIQVTPPPIGIGALSAGSGAGGLINSDETPHTQKCIAATLDAGWSITEDALLLFGVGELLKGAELTADLAQEMGAEYLSESWGIGNYQSDRMWMGVLGPTTQFGIQTSLGAGLAVAEGENLSAAKLAGVVI